MKRFDLLKQDFAKIGGVETADELLMAKREFGLRFMVEAKRGQDLADVQAVFAAAHAGFRVEPLFPSPEFTAVSADYPAPFRLYETGYCARLGGIEPGDLGFNVFDLAYDLKRTGKFVRIEPDLPMENLMAPSVDKGPGGNGSVPTNRAWALEAMRVRQAWAATGRNRGRGVFIGHPDTGWYPHVKWNGGGLRPELGRNFMPGEDPNDPKDRLSPGQPGHGLHTGSVMTFPGDIRPDGGDTVPAGQVTGVAPDAVNVPIRCISTVVLYPGQEEVARAIMYAVQRDCQVISLSLGGAGLWAWLGGPMTEALRKNRITVAAAGNFPDSVPMRLRLTVEPANWNSAIAVTACTVQDHAWPNSGGGDWSGAWKADISAPGVNVWCGVVSGGYNTGSGTSYATAHLAGVASLWLAHHFPNGYAGRRPLLEVFKEHLNRTARKPNGWNRSYGAGIVDAHALVTTSPNLSPVVSAVDKARNKGQNNALAGVLGADGWYKACVLVGEMLLGVASEAHARRVKRYSRELAQVIYGRPVLRMGLCGLLGSLSGELEMSWEQVRDDLREAVTGAGSEGLKQAMGIGTLVEAV